MSVHEAPDPRTAVRGAEAVFNGGGNTFRLLKLLQDEGLLGPIRTSVQAVVEVGVASGASLLLWREYFPRAHIHRIDTWTLGASPNERITLHQQDAYRGELLFGSASVDVAIDDGSHEIEDQILFIERYLPAVRRGGLLVIEDIFHFDQNAGRLYDAVSPDLRPFAYPIDMNQHPANPQVHGGCSVQFVVDLRYA